MRMRREWNFYASSPAVFITDYSSTLATF